MSQRRTVAIIGGGPGGLFAAWHLDQKSGDAFEVTIYEASGRLGGKIVTKAFKGAGNYEAGVAEIYDYSRTAPDPLKQLIEGDLGLKTMPIAGGGCVLDGKIVQSVDDLAGAFSEATRDAAQGFRDACRQMLTPVDYYKSSRGGDNAHPWAGASAHDLLAREVQDLDAQRYLNVMSHSDVSAPLHHTDGLNLMKNVLMDVPGYIDVYSVIGGNEGIVRSLASEIEAKIELDAPVKRVTAKSEGGFVLSFAPSAGRADVEADVVIMALPMMALSLVEFAPLALHNTMSAHVGHYDRAGHYLRATLLFEKPFWRSKIAGDWWMMDAFGGCCVYDESARHDHGAMGALGFLVAGNGAIEWANQSDEAFVARCLASLPPEFGDAKAMLVDSDVKRWLGSVNALPGGRPAKSLAEAHQPEPSSAPGFFLIGDYLYDSTLNGVLDSADAATDMVVSRFMGYGEERGSSPRALLPEFDARFVAETAKRIWGLGAGARVLHLGSGDGAFVAALRAAGLDAHGLEAEKTLWAEAAPELREFNHHGAFDAAPFANARFDVVIESCLCRADDAGAQAIIAEIARLARHGCFLGSPTTDLPLERLQRDRLLADAGSPLSRGEWAERLGDAGFEQPLFDPRALDDVWAIAQGSPSALAAFEDVESLMYSVYGAPAHQAVVDWEALRAVGVDANAAANANSAPARPAIRQ